MNKQREVLYGFRNDIIRGDNPREAIFDIIEEVVEARVVEYCPAGQAERRMGTRRVAAVGEPGVPHRPAAGTVERQDRRGMCADVILDKVKRAYEAKAANENPDALKAIERLIVLNALDRLWQEHLYNMDQLRDGIGLRAYGQKDPLVEYKTEAFAMFDEMRTT